MSANALRADLYSRVTAKIVADLERGVRPWLKPWNAEHAAGRITRPLRSNGQPYKGINVLMLWGEAEVKGYACPIWMTFRQALELQGHVRKGEHGSLVVYADKITRIETGDDGEEALRQISFMKGYTVFNCEQIEGLPPHFLRGSGAIRAGAHRGCRAVLSRNRSRDPARRRPRLLRDHGRSRADATLRVLPRCGKLLRDPAARIDPLWTRHETRLNREFGRKRWGDAGYAAEELVAEIGAAFLCADLDLAAEPREDHASYLASWLEVLKNDHRAIFTAAAHAQRAADFLHGLQRQEPLIEAAA